VGCICLGSDTVDSGRDARDAAGVDSEEVHAVGEVVAAAVAAIGTESPERDPGR
jgi:hypothetical protein